MEIFTKEIDEITEQDLIELENFPNNFESHRLDYKVTYKITPQHSNEFLRDIISFANTHSDSIIIYGMNDDGKLIGMERNHSFDEDILQNHFINILESSVQPKIKNFVRVQPISVKSDRFAMIVKIIHSDNIIYGIRQKLSKKDYGKQVDAYEFWSRSSGNKKPMNLHEVVRHILSKDKPELKILGFLRKKPRINISKLMKLSKTGYVKTNFRLKNIGKVTSNNVKIRLFFSTYISIDFLNKWNYKQKFGHFKEDEIMSVSSLVDQMKKIKKLKNPSIVATKRGNKTNWSFQYKINSINPDDTQTLPPMYIKPPENVPEGKIVFKVNIFSDENVKFDDEILTISWKIPQ